MSTSAQPLIQYDNDDELAKQQLNAWLLSGPRGTVEENRTTFMAGLNAISSTNHLLDNDDRYSEAWDGIQAVRDSAQLDELFGSDGRLFARLAISYCTEIRQQYSSDLLGVRGNEASYDLGADLLGSFDGGRYSLRPDDIGILNAVAQGTANGADMARFINVALKESVTGSFSDNDERTALTWALENVNNTPGDRLAFIQTLNERNSSVVSTHLAAAIDAIDDTTVRAQSRLAAAAYGKPGASGDIPFGLSAEEIVTAFTATGSVSQAELDAELQSLTESLPLDVVTVLVEQGRVNATAITPSMQSFADTKALAEGLTDANAAEQIGQIVTNLTALDDSADGFSQNRTFRQIFDATPVAQQDDLLLALYQQMGDQKFQSFIKDHSGFTNRDFDSLVKPRLTEAQQSLTEGGEAFATTVGALDSWFDANPSGRTAAPGTTASGTNTAEPRTPRRALLDMKSALGYVRREEGEEEQQDKPGSLSNIFGNLFTGLFGGGKSPEELEREAVAKQLEEAIVAHPQSEYIRGLQDLGITFEVPLPSAEQLDGILEERINQLLNLPADHPDFGRDIRAFQELHQRYLNGESGVSIADVLGAASALAEITEVVPEMVVRGSRVNIPANSNNPAENDPAALTSEDLLNGEVPEGADLAGQIRSALSDTFLNGDYTVQEILASLDAELTEGVTVVIPGDPETVVQLSGDGSGMVVTQGGQPLTGEALDAYWQALGSNVTALNGATLVIGERSYPLAADAQSLTFNELGGPGATPLRIDIPQVQLGG